MSAGGLDRPPQTGDRPDRRPDPRLDSRWSSSRSGAGAAPGGPPPASAGPPASCRPDAGGHRPVPPECSGRRRPRLSGGGSHGSAVRLMSATARADAVPTRRIQTPSSHHPNRIGGLIRFHEPEDLRGNFDKMSRSKLPSTGCVSHARWWSGRRSAGPHPITQLRRWAVGSLSGQILRRTSRTNQRDQLRETPTDTASLVLASWTPSTTRVRCPRKRVRPNRAIITALRRHRPDGHAFGPDACVFGSEIGERVGSVKTAWRAICRRAEIDDLNFHDLRREAGSRLLEGGMPEHYVQRFLDHATSPPRHGIWPRRGAGCTKCSGNTSNVRQ